jgi:hypothetical protein
MESQIGFEYELEEKYANGKPSRRWGKGSYERERRKDIGRNTGGSGSMYGGGLWIEW